MRPETGPHRRRKMVVRTIIAVIFLAMAAGAAWWWLQDNSDDAAPVAANTEEPTPTTAPTEPTVEPDRPDTAQDEAAESAATQALVAGGLVEIAVTIEDGTAVLTGSVASEDTKAAAAAAVDSVAGVSAVDNQIVVEPPPPVDPAELPAAAEQARDEAGFGHLGVTVIDGTATITGIVPLAELDGGYFAYTAPLREALLAINGIDAVRTRLQLRGEVGTLSRQLDELVERSPIVFAAGSAELTPQDELVLDEAAVIISESPGLVVLVAGHTDPTGEDAANAVLAQERADTVVAYLTGRGIPVTRMAPVTFGELFPSPINAPEAGQGILFEVTP
jgi:outer membrane protein OmpA-like peptidoglycan-associated protein